MAELRKFASALMVTSALSCFIFGCTEPVADTQEEVAIAADALHAGACPVASSIEYAHPDAIIPAGVAGGRDFVFVGSPIDGRVMVLARSSGKQLSELPQPPGGFVLPLVIHSIGPQRVAILDCGGFPAPGVVDADPTIYEYEYERDETNGGIAAHLARTVHFTGRTIGFAEEFVYLGGGEYLVPDAVYGSIWHVDADGNVKPGIVPRTFDPADAIPEMVYCPTMPQVTVGGLPFLFTGSTVPGVAGIAVRDGVVFFYSSCAAGLFRFPFKSLFDSRKPWERAADIRLVGKKPDGVEVEELLEMQFNPFDHDDRHLYVADALQLRLIRIDPHDGKREVVADDPRLFNFPASLGFLPPLGREAAPLLVLSNQQHRTPLTNDALTVDVTERPFILTKVLLKNSR